MILSGKELAANIKAGIAAEIPHLQERYGRVPHLVAYKRVANGKIVKVRSHYRTIEG